MSAWTAHDMPDQTGRVAVVTGANTGIGYETALALVGAGGTVVLACRSRERGEDALGRIRGRTGTPGEPTAPPVAAGAAAEAPAEREPKGRREGSAELGLLDLAHLDSVRSFAQDLLARHPRLDLLINNAAVMIPPFTRTEQGAELQFAVNHLGHFALTGLLLERLEATPGARVVTVASTAHRRGRIDFANLRGERPYVPFREYAQSKLANLVFALELHRRLAAAGKGTVSVAAHPGWVATDLQRHNRLVAAAVHLWSQDARSGAAPILYAATDPGALAGGYYGPDGLLEYRGDPAPAAVSHRALDRGTAERLWRVSEELTGVRYLDGS